MIDLISCKKVLKKHHLNTKTEPF